MANETRLLTGAHWHDGFPAGSPGTGPGGGRAGAGAAGGRGHDAVPVPRPGRSYLLRPTPRLMVWQSSLPLGQWPRSLRASGGTDVIKFDQKIDHTKCWSNFSVDGVFHSLGASNDSTIR
jgi:hypothetical protein